MTITPTALLSLPIITTGTESGTWGDVVDNGLTSYLDIAIAGGLAVTIAGTTTVTLANTAGTSSATGITSTTAQYAILNISGAKTGNCTLVLPSSSRRYTINNAGTSTGVGNPWTLTVKGAATTGITLIDGEKVDIAWDGTDYVKVGLSSQPSAPISFPNTGTTTGVLLQSAGASSAPLATGDGSTAINFAGYLSNPKLNVTDTGGSSVQTMYGALLQPAVLNTGASTTITVNGMNLQVVRGNANDLSTGAANSLVGVQSTVTTSVGLPTTAVTNAFTGYRAIMNGQGGIINDAAGFYSSMNLFTTNTTNSSTVSSVYGVRASTTIGASSGTGFTVTNRYGVSVTDTTSATATVTNYYGLYLTHTVTGTVTNRYGVYSADALATNHFAGPVLVAGSSSGLGYKTGAGGTVTQATSISTNVTLNTPTGKITCVSTTFTSGTTYSFNVLNTVCDANSVYIVSLDGNSTTTNTSAYQIWAVGGSTNSFGIYIRTNSTVTNTLVINFAVIKGAIA